MKTIETNTTYSNAVENNELFKAVVVREHINIPTGDYSYYGDYRVERVEEILQYEEVSSTLYNYTIAAITDSDMDDYRDLYRADAMQYVLDLQYHGRYGRSYGRFLLDSNLNVVDTADSRFYTKELLDEIVADKDVVLIPQNEEEWGTIAPAAKIEYEGTTYYYADGELIDETH